MELIITHSSLDFDGLSCLVAAKKLYPKAQGILPASLEKSVREFILFYGEELDLIRESECDLSDVNKLIVVDTHLKSRLGKFAELVDKPGIEIHLYDHHSRTHEDIKAREDITKNVGATSTLLVGLIKKRGINISPFEATVLSLGIYEDTGFFSFPTTTSLDLETAAFLSSKGADINTIARYLRRAITEEDLFILSELLKSMKLYSIGGVDIGIALYRYTKYIEELGSLANKLIDILDAEGLFVIAKIDSKCQFTARSRTSSLDVNKVMKHFDGGGHRTAASAFVKEENMESLRESLLKILEKHLKPRLFASDIMSCPVKTIGVNQTVAEARDIMDSYGIGGLPVLEKGKAIGMITRIDARRAENRGFLHSRVKGYMSYKVMSVGPDEPVYKIRDIMLKSNSGRVVVMDGRRLIGMVTRSDLLRGNFKGPSKRAPLVKANILDNKHPNIKDKILKNFPKDIIGRIKLIGELSHRNGFRSFLVGGFVRDLMLGVRNLDLDIVVEPVCPLPSASSASPSGREASRTGRKDAIKLARIFADKVGGALVVYDKFATASVVMKDKSKVDFATAREEYYEYPAALPTVEFSTIKQDLYRRDFTINAMALRIDRKNFGELLDFFGGLADLKKKRIRVLHGLSFVDDPTRIFRAVRFEQRYNFKIEPSTEALIKNAIEIRMFERISKQRLREELIRILSEDNPIKAIKRMADLNEMRFIHPSINFNIKKMELLGSARKAIKWFGSAPRRRNLDRWLVYFMVLVDGLKKNELEEVIAKFVFKNEDAKRLLSSKVVSEKITRKLSAKKALPPSEIFKALEELSYETLVFIMAKSSLDKGITERVSRFLTEYNGTRLSIAGRDLKAFGLKPGPEFKKILTKVLFAKLDKGLRTKKEEIDFLRKSCKI